MRALLCGLGGLALVACERGPERAPAPDASPSAGQAAPPISEPAEPEPLHVEAGDRSLSDRLRSAPLASLQPPLAEGGAFRARIVVGDTQRPAQIHLATLRAPTHQRRAVAFSRLCDALELGVCAVVVDRYFSLRELAPHLAEQAQRLRILPDGTVPGVLVTPGVPGHDLWSPPPGRDVAFANVAPDSTTPESVAAYVTARVADYLAAHVLRREVRVAPEAIYLLDNTAAFTPHADPRALDRLLEPLRSVAPVPPELAKRLEELDRPRLTELLSKDAAGFELLSPREIVELDERRRTLVSLFRARRASH